MAKSAEEKIAELEARQKELTAKLREKERAAKKRTRDKIKLLKKQASEQARRRDTRCKILIGASILSEIKNHAKDGRTRAWVSTVLKKHITEPRDLKLLNECYPDLIKNQN